jgi:hypothetical protein
MNRPIGYPPAAKHLAIFKQFRYVHFRIVFLYLGNLISIAVHP